MPSKSERFFLKIGPSTQFLDFHILFMYLALSFFRLASIVQGVVARFHQVLCTPASIAYVAIAYV